MFKTIFKELGISETTEDVFNDLLTTGPSIAKLIAQRIDIPRPSVYDHLKLLKNVGLVGEKEEDGKTIFYIDNIKNLQEMLSSKIRKLEEEKKKIEISLPEILKKTSFVEPKIKFYTGKDGVKQVMNHIMLNRNIETELFWPMSEMLKVLGAEYLKELNEKRVQRNIFIKAIWPKDKLIDFDKYPYLKSGEETLRELRIPPDNITWNMGYWMYEDSIAFLSSEKEGFGFVVKSKDFTDLMRLNFNNIWEISKPIE